MDVTMPQLGETVTEGTITRWLKQVGEHVEADEPLFEVSTDKVDSEVPAPSGGVVTEIRVPEGETVGRGHRARGRRAMPRRPPAPVRHGAAPAPPPAAPEPAAAAAAEPSRSRPPAPEPSTAPPLPTSGARAEPRARPANAVSRARARTADAIPVPEPVPGRRQSRRRPALTSPVVRRLVAERGLDPARSPAPARAAASPARTCSTPSPPAPLARRRLRRSSARAPSAPPSAPAPAPRRARRRVGSAVRTGARGFTHRRRGRPVRQHPPAHRRAHGAVEGHERARVHVGRGRLRARRAGARRAPARVARARRASRSPTCRSSRVPFSDTVDDFPQVERERRRRHARACTTTSTSRSPSTSTSRGSSPR